MNSAADSADTNNVVSTSGALRRPAAVFAAAWQARRGVTDWFGPLLFAVLYFLAARAGIAVLADTGGVAVFWPPTGVLVGALLLQPLSERRTVALALPAGILANLTSNVPIGLGLVFSSTNVCTALVAARAIQRVLGSPTHLLTPADVAKFTAVALAADAAGGIPAALVSARANGLTFFSVWRVWWLADFVGIMVVTPVLIALTGGAAAVRRPARALEAAALLAGLVVVTWLVFAQDPLTGQQWVDLPYLTFPFFVWAAVRFGASGSSMAVLVVTTIAVWQTVHGLGPFSVAVVSLSTRALKTRAFLGVMSLSSLMLAAVISQLRRAEDALRTRERLVRLSVEHTPAAVAMVDRDMRYLVTSRRWLTDFGLDGDSVVGRSHYEVFPDLPDERKEIHQRCLAGAIERRDEDHIMRPDGTPEWVRWEIQPWREDNGRIGGLIFFVEFLTQRKRAEDALEKAELRLRQAQRLEAIGRLAGGVAHDFNNLLMPILGYATLLRESFESNDPRCIDAQRIEEAAERAAALTQQLLAFGRKQQLAMQVLDLAERIAAFEPLLRRTIRENIHLQLQYDPALPTVRADPSQIDQVLMNLVLNGQDAMPHGGTLTVATRSLTVPAPLPSVGDTLSSGTYGALVVKDTGSGMAPETLSRAFEPFFTTKPPGKGTGLGLATVYGIVKQHGGHVLVDTAPGGGTTVTICLPPAGAPKTLGAADRASATAPGGQETILLVEDELLVLEFITAGLTQSGYTVLEAHSGEEALAIAERHIAPIDLLLTDVVMPGINGDELAAQFAEQYPVTAILTMSAHRDRRATGRFSWPFLVKPFTIDALKQAIRQQLDAAPRHHQNKAP